MYKRHAPKVSFWEASFMKGRESHLGATKAEAPAAHATVIAQAVFIVISEFCGTDSV